MLDRSSKNLACSQCLYLIVISSWEDLFLLERLRRVAYGLIFTIKWLVAKMFGLKLENLNLASK